MRLLLATICILVFFSAPAFARGPQPAPVPLSTDPDDFIAHVSDESATKFKLEVIAPKDSVSEYALCKAVAQAEIKGAQEMSLSDPKFGVLPKTMPGNPRPIPADWVDVRTVVYLTNPNPSGNPAFKVADKAAACSHAWDWFKAAIPSAAYPSLLAKKSMQFAGKTNADPALVNNVFNNIMHIATTKLNCASTNLVTQQILPVQYKPLGEKFDDPKTTFEKWTVALCGFNEPFLVGFWKAPGGTMFRVVFPIPPAEQPQ